MNIVNSIRYWFQKSASYLGFDTVMREQQARYNALMNANPKRLIDAITAYNCGHIGELARIVEEYELRDDKMRTCSKKLRASVARCDYTISVREGFADDERAKRHVEVLTRFWSGVKATNRFKLDEVGGFNLLIKQMMEAESLGFAVHEIVWRVLPNGELAATFIKIPLWHFENRTGKLRFLRQSEEYDGEPMLDGEWLVATGDAIGIAASICACLKRCTLADWAVYCERCGMPFFVAKTGAQFKSQQWNNLSEALKAIGRDARIQVDKNTDINAVQTGGNGNPPYGPYVEWADRAISSLYRGADLSTMSKDGMAVGASLQGDEMGIIEQDACARLSETLQEKVCRYVIRFVCGDNEPLAQIEIKPTKKPNISQEIEIDNHLISHGVKLGKKDAAQRYGRATADAEGDEVMEQATVATTPQTGAATPPKKEAK